MDDVGPTVVTKRDMPQTATQRDVQHQPWSCIDYVDTEHVKDAKPTQGRPAEVPTGDKHFSTRFGGLDGHDERREDSHGRCKGYSSGGRELPRGCTAASMEIEGDDLLWGVSSGHTHKQWTDKQTEAGLGQRRER